MNNLKIIQNKSINDISKIDRGNHLIFCFPNGVDKGFFKSFVLILSRVIYKVIEYITQKTTTLSNVAAIEQLGWYILKDEERQ